jgi:hypothetical protein
LEPVSTAVVQAAVVEIPDDDSPPLGWGQWENLPAPVPEPAAGVLVVREDDRLMPPPHGGEASSSCAGLPTPNIAVVGLEQEREPAGVPPTYFNEAQAEQALWQEFRDHGASLSNALNEALRIHAGPAWQIFNVRAFGVELEVFSCHFRAHAFSDLAFSHVSFIIDRSFRAVPERGTTTSIG